ncbi:MAG: hypothetical protein NTW67_05660 [Candidatus Woesearchaeota archaeon]|nr:hypothetical protein [Candidatus Woesearchaeota archaeon]
MSLTDLLNKKVIIPVFIAGAALFAQNARADDTFTDTDTEQETTADGSDGYLAVSGNKSRLQYNASTSGQFQLKAKNWRPSISAFLNQSTFTEDGPDTVIESRRGMIGLGGYLIGSKEVELFLDPQIGYEFNHFMESINMNADRAIVGGQAGIASQALGTRLLITSYFGEGKADFKLQSGFTGNGRYGSYFMSAEASQRLFGSKKSADSESFSASANLGEEFENSLYIALSGMMKSDRLGDLQTATGWNAKIQLPYVFNARQQKKDAKGNIYATGTILRLIPFAMEERYNTESDLSLRTTESKTDRVGLRAEFEVVKGLGLAVEGGYQWSFQKIEDPGRGLDTHRHKDGAFAGAGVYARW